MKDDDVVDQLMMVGLFVSGLPVVTTALYTLVRANIKTQSHGYVSLTASVTWSLV